MSAVLGEVVHRVGAVGLAAGLCTQSALALARRRTGRRVRRRGAEFLAVDARDSMDVCAPTQSAGGGVGAHGTAGRVLRWLGRGVPAASARQWAAALGVVPAGWILVGGLLGWAVGLGAGYGAWRWQRSRLGQEPRRAAQEATAVAEAVRQLPLAADLLAACISVGAGPREAAEAVGESLGGPVGEQLARTAAEIRLGGDPAVAWGRFGEIPGAAALARCLDRAGATGAPAAEPVSRLAEAMRAERSSAAVARAQRAGVLITAPVGLCFLPAFLTVGVAPVVIGLAKGLLSP
ncbi:type II secretion system F family protein [Streptomyces sp. NPDC058221]|uniref:type II secretion system F family protein n=1 Tax=Streptomyces sp. NPDC058221 TaxID=3346388 RepID=UPI0036EBE7D0